MSFSVNTNTNALAALQTLNFTQQALTKVQGRVSSGLKVAGAADDASTFAIAQGQRGDIAGFQSISNSLALGTAFINVALNGAQTISNTLNSIKAKVVQAQDPTQDRNAIQNDITAFINQIDSLAAASQFNGVNLLSGGANSQNVLSSLNRIGNTIATASITVAGQDLRSAGIGISGINVAAGSVTLNAVASTNAANNDKFVINVVNNSTATATTTTTTFEFVTAASVSLTAAGNIAVLTGTTLAGTIANLNAALQKNGFTTAFNATGNDVISSVGGTTAVGATSGFTGTIAGSFGAATPGTNASPLNLTVIETAINTVKTALSQLGTAANAIATQTNFVKSLTDSLTGGVSQLVDADLAAESANLQSLQTKQQLGIQALSIANQGPGAILALFR
jgi:flagellin